jgi:hypothetical protein
MDFDYAFEAMMSAEEQIERAQLRGKMEERRRILEKLAQLELQGKKLKSSPRELAQFFWGTN